MPKTKEEMPVKTSDATDSAQPVTKERIWLRLDQEVVKHFRASGRYWNESANDILVEHVKRNKA